MGKVEIYFVNNSEKAEFEAIQKGYRLDVYVKIDDAVFNIRVYDIVRLKQDFEDEIVQYGYYSIDSNLILVKQVSRKEICFTLENLFREKYFENLKPVGDIDSDILNRIK